MNGDGASRLALRGAAQAALQVLLVAVLFAALQFLAGRHNVRFDLTPTQRFTMSPYARQAVENFPGSGRIYAFYDSQQVIERRRLLDLLDQIHSVSPRLSFELVDLDRKPGLAKKYGVSTYGSGVLDLDDGTRVQLRSITEEAITAALLRLTREELGVLCFFTGHGGRDPRDTDPRGGLSKLTQVLEREGFSVAWRATFATGDEPCTVLLWVGPTHDLLEGEAEAIEKTVHGGGRALFLLDPGTAESFDALLRRFAIEPGRNIIVDEASRMIGADSFVPRVDRFRPDVFDDRLGAAAVLPVARTMRATGVPVEGVRVISLAGTSESSWAYSNATEIPGQDVQFRQQQDELGPLSIAVRATTEGDSADGSGPGQVIAVGDADFVTNAHIEALGNSDFILSLIGILAEDTTLIGTRRDDSGDPHRPLSLNAAQTRTIFWVGVVALPGASALAGALLAALRRRRRGGR